MTAQRTAAIILIILLAAVFAGMIAALFMGNYNLFFILGGILAGLVILGLIFLKVVKKDGKNEAPKGI